MEYELINPSDPYTFIAKSHEVAALVVLLLGEGAYGAKSQRRSKNGDEVPLFLFGGVTEWYSKTFGRTFEEGLKTLEFNIADALDTFMLGGFDDRRRYESALKAITDDDKREAFKAEWQSSHTSTNDIGSRARELATAIRFSIAERETEGGVG